MRFDLPNTALGSAQYCASICQILRFDLSNTARRSAQYHVKMTNDACVIGYKYWFINLNMLHIIMQVEWMKIN